MGFQGSAMAVRMGIQQVLRSLLEGCILIEGDNALLFYRTGAPEINPTIAKQRFEWIGNWYEDLSRHPFFPGSSEEIETEVEVITEGLRHLYTLFQDLAEGISSLNFNDREFVVPALGGWKDVLRQTSEPLVRDPFFQKWIGGPDDRQPHFEIPG